MISNPPHTKRYQTRRKPNQIQCAQRVVCVKGLSRCSSKALLRIFSTEGRGFRLCKAPLQPTGPQGSQEIYGYLWKYSKSKRHEIGSRWTRGVRNHRHTIRRTTDLSSEVNLPTRNLLSGLVWYKSGHVTPQNPA